MLYETNFLGRQNHDPPVPLLSGILFTGILFTSILPSGMYPFCVEARTRTVP